MICSCIASKHPQLIHHKTAIKLLSCTIYFVWLINSWRVSSDVIRANITSSSLLDAANKKYFPASSVTQIMYFRFGGRHLGYSTFAKKVLLRDSRQLYRLACPREHTLVV